MNPVPVLMYHHVAADREVTPADFERHLRYFRENGWRTPDLGEFADFLNGERSLPGKNVLLTFDDGYADNWICAAPLLKKYGFRAVVFVTTSRLTDNPPRKTLADGAASPDTLKNERGPDGFLSWREVKIMTESGVFEAGSHTETHNNFDKRAKWADMEGELRRSAAVIDDKTGARPLGVGWPWGYFEPRFLDYAKRAGYKLAFTTRPGANISGKDTFHIRRFKIKTGNLNWLKRRLWLYGGQPALAELYGSLHG
ncbi:MAG: polysaccharide deacetylase family protein [Elusimicrobiales bacterium]|nr:polysaccharide deacetylase family protein [Elusimicrobiales bacterium]